MLYLALQESLLRGADPWSLVLLWGGTRSSWAQIPSLAERGARKKSDIFKIAQKALVTFKETDAVGASRWVLESFRSEFHLQAKASGKFP
jgi:hypothetical protein